MENRRRSSTAGMAGPAVLLLLLAAGLSCGSGGEHPVEPGSEGAPDAASAKGGTGAAATPEGAPDRFEGEIGHFEQGEAFTRFIFDHELKVVSFDAEMIPGPLDDESGFEIVNDTFGVDSFVVWEECFEPLGDGEKRTTSKCTGTEISIDRSRGATDSDLTLIRGVLRLEGYFVVQGCDGPFQGLMGCSLRPLDVDAAR